VTIANDDLDENPYIFTLSGTGVAPEINVMQGVSEVPSGSGSYGFGSLLVGSSSSPTIFTIENFGTADLKLSGSPRVVLGGADAGMFSVSLQPGSPVAPSSSTTFTITFSPTSAGAKAATVSIANDDSDENPYTFSLSGTGVTPEINLKQGTTDIPSGGTYDFADVGVGIGGSTITFTIENLGSADLNLLGNPRVAVGGAEAGMFTVDAQPSSPIGPSSSITFTITFDPLSVGSKTATVTITNDDSDESTYSFTLTGNGV
jgi:hypothetical protein